ncbi:DoxX family protein [Paenibacillus pinistramenti]|uniref:DoxX family protein n=1 Tax=Paenibacillus pinistramenti TaxID=1768003 RepID=UPI001108BFF1|nr:DoxX family protein [Paenibacillus pinistramenti]
MNMQAVVTLIMRIGLGVLFLVHGINKFQAGLGNVAIGFENAGTPGFLAYIAGPLETFGGILLILGLFTRYISAYYVIQMVMAIITMKLSAGLLGNGQMAGSELDITYLLLALYLAAAKTVPVSADALFKRKNRNEALVEAAE